MTYQPGDDVTVTFNSVEHRGEVERYDNGWVHVLMYPDPVAEYEGQLDEMLNATTRHVVCVRDKFVRPMQ